MVYLIDGRIFLSEEELLIWEWYNRNLLDSSGLAVVQTLRTRTLGDHNNLPHQSIRSDVSANYTQIMNHLWPGRIHSFDSGVIEFNYLALVVLRLYSYEEFIDRWMDGLRVNERDIFDAAMSSYERGLDAGNREAWPDIYPVCLSYTDSASRVAMAAVSAENASLPPSTYWADIIAPDRMNNSTQDARQAVASTRPSISGRRRRSLEEIEMPRGGMFSNDPDSPVTDKDRNLKVFDEERDGSDIVHNLRLKYRHSAVRHGKDLLFVDDFTYISGSSNIGVNLHYRRYDEKLDQPRKMKINGVQFDLSIPELGFTKVLPDYAVFLSPRVGSYQRSYSGQTVEITTYYGTAPSRTLRLDPIAMEIAQAAFNPKFDQDLIELMRKETPIIVPNRAFVLMLSSTGAYKLKYNMMDVGHINPKTQSRISPVGSLKAVLPLLKEEMTEELCQLCK